MNRSHDLYCTGHTDTNSQIMFLQNIQGTQLMLNGQDI